MLLRLLKSFCARLAPAPLRGANFGSMLEPLEDRIAPASLITIVNTRTATFLDANHNTVTVKSSHPLFTAATVASILQLDGTGTHLQEINLTAVDSKIATGDSISVSVSGTGTVDVGFIDANVALGAITVHGNLGQIDAGYIAGTGSHYTGLTSLTVNSLGFSGTAIQAAKSTLTSTIYGNVGSINVAGNINDAIVSVAATGAASNGNIGSIKIGGSLIGNSDTASASFTTSGNVGSIFIGGDMRGESGQSSASLQIGGKIGSLTVNGSVLGYSVAGDTTAQSRQGSASVTHQRLLAAAGWRKLTIGGSVTGGDGLGSASIGASGIGGTALSSAGGNIGTIKIGGSVTGGSGDYSADIEGNLVGAVTIGKAIVGSSGLSSGSLNSEFGIKTLTIQQGPNDLLVGSKRARSPIVGEHRGGLRLGHHQQTQSSAP